MTCSPTQRSLDHLRAAGWQPWVVEKWIAQARQRFDLWGFGDILAAKEGEAHLIVQTTTQSNAAARVAKILDEPRAKLWLSTGGRIVVHGWRKLGARGKRKLWEVSEREITVAEFS